MRSAATINRWNKGCGLTFAISGSSFTRTGLVWSVIAWYFFLKVKFNTHLPSIDCNILSTMS